MTPVSSTAVSDEVYISIGEHFQNQGATVMRIGGIWLTSQYREILLTSLAAGKARQMSGSDGERVVVQCIVKMQSSDGLVYDGISQ